MNRVLLSENAQVESNSAIPFESRGDFGIFTKLVQISNRIVENESPVRAADCASSCRFSDYEKDNNH
jgi:hypothetical protein